MLSVCLCVCMSVDSLLGFVCVFSACWGVCVYFQFAEVCVCVLSVCWGLFFVSGRHHFAAHFSILALTFLLELVYYLTAVPAEGKDSITIYSQHSGQL